jgi:hypothetical protein
MKMLTITSTAPTIHAHAGGALILSGIFLSSRVIPHWNKRNLPLGANQGQTRGGTRQHWYRSLRGRRTLTFRGRGYGLGVGGIDYGLVFGGSKTVFHGRVRNIQRTSEVAGVYAAAGRPGCPRNRAHQPE